MWKKSDVDVIKKMIIPILVSHGVNRADLFGSYVCGDMIKDGDIDILV